MSKFQAALLKSPAATRYSIHVLTIKNHCNLIVLPPLKMSQPINIPASSPVMTGSGIAVGGAEKDTPPTKTTASRPSRTTVKNGRTNIAYFFVQSDRREDQAIFLLE